MQLFKGGHDLAVRLAAGNQLWASIQNSTDVGGGFFAFYWLNITSETWQPQSICSLSTDLALPALSRSFGSFLGVR